MGNVGQVVITARGILAILEAQTRNRRIKPQFYRVSNRDIALDPTLTSLPNVWKQGDISGYLPISQNTVEFLIDIPPEEAIDYGRTFGLYLDDGTLFAIAKPPYPFPPMLRQTFRVQISYSNIARVIDFQYIPFLEAEQSLSILDATTTLAERIQILRKEVEDLQLAKERLFANDRETFKDLAVLNEKIERMSEKLDTLHENLLALAGSFYNLAYYVLRNSIEIQKLKGGA